jgi:hypothetical protein
MFTRIVLSAFLLVTFTSVGAQTDPSPADTWLEVLTPHFVVVSNSTEEESRRAALQFERMRTVFQAVFPNANLDTASPILVLAVADKKNLQALEPAAYSGKGQLNSCKCRNGLMSWSG